VKPPKWHTYMDVGHREVLTRISTLVLKNIGMDSWLWLPRTTISNLLGPKLKTPSSIIGSRFPSLRPGIAMG